jgi:hypothetical protein
MQGYVQIPTEIDCFLFRAYASIQTALRVFVKIYMIKLLLLNKNAVNIHVI